MLDVDVNGYTHGLVHGLNTFGRRKRHMSVAVKYTMDAGVVNLPVQSTAALFHVFEGPAGAFSGSDCGDKTRSQSYTE